MSSTVLYSPIECPRAEPLGPRPSLDDSVVEMLANAMAVRDWLTQEHAQRVRHYAVALAAEIGVDDDVTLSAIRAAAILHDVGKLGIPEDLLQKPGPLTPDEYEVVKRHAAIGADLVAAATGPGLLPRIVRHHHENWDGSGYPDRLAGESIPVGARVIAIVDCYDALTSDRPYRLAVSHTSALETIHDRRATMYDPRLIDAFMRVLWRRRAAATNRGTSLLRLALRHRDRGGL